MSSEDEDMEYDSPDEENQDENPATSTLVLPALSKAKYDKTYDEFKKWHTLRAKESISEDVMMTYFTALSKNHKPSTLWTYYSMLKATLKLKDNVDIASYSKLFDFLKKNNVGYKPIKNTFTEAQIEKFINEAPDEKWLHVKVMCIFGVNGVHSSKKLISIKPEHIKQYDDLILVTVPKNGTIAKISFTITGTFFNIVKKYAALRPGNAIDNRFFLHYRDGECTAQPVGVNKFLEAPRKIAKYLKLPKPEHYTVNSFRIPSANVIANTNASVADHPIQYSLDYETGLLRSSSVSCTSLPVSAVPSVPSNNGHINNGEHSRGDSNGHICSLSCGQVKCAKEENEKSVFHAFDVMKPASFNIAEVTPAQFAYEPLCRWIVAYTHNSEPVSSFNADGTFQAITKSIPYNVRVVQEYIRGNSSQLVPAYVVVYGVTCRCHKEPSDIFSFTVNEIKCEI